MQVAPFRRGATSHGLYTVGMTVGLAVGCEEAGLAVGLTVGMVVGSAVGLAVGSEVAGLAVSSFPSLSCPSLSLTNH
jgi:hypothetical protein